MSKPDYLISTPENVDLHLELAGIGNRVLACFIDTALTALITVALALVCWGLWYLSGLFGLSNSQQGWAGALLSMVFLLVSFFVWLGYFIVFEGFWQGQTPGKKIMNIRVIELNGQPVTWGAVFFRNFMRFLDEGVGLIGLLAMLIDKTERRFGDLAAGTVVIRERRSELAEQAISDLARRSTLDVGSISPQEYDILVNFLKRRKALAKSQRPLVARQLAQYFRHKLGEDHTSAFDFGNSQNSGQVQSRSDSEVFLETIYAAYRARADI